MQPLRCRSHFPGLMNMKPLGLLLFAGITGAVIALDQWTKWLIVHTFTLHEAHVVFPDLFNLVYYTNNGAAFSLLAGQPAIWRQTFFISITIIALIVLLFAYRSYASINGWYRIALGLIAGGALGNFIDRIRLGYVVDFLDFSLGGHHWPAFNVADSAITVGVALFMLVSVFSQNNTSKSLEV